MIQEIANQNTAWVIGFLTVVLVAVFVVPLVMFGLKKLGDKLDGG
jgi:hypothetical protein